MVVPVDILPASVCVCMCACRGSRCHKVVREAKTLAAAAGKEDVSRGKETGMDIWRLQFLCSYTESLGGLEPVAISHLQWGHISSGLWPVMSVGGCSRTESPGEGIHPPSPPSLILKCHCGLIGCAAHCPPPPHLQQ